MPNIFITNTGLGYLRDSQGRITDKVDVPAGSHPIKDGYVFTEVKDQTELDAVVVWKDPADVEKMQSELKIQNKIRQTAIDALIAAGELPSDYE